MLLLLHAMRFDDGRADVQRVLGINECVAVGDASPKSRMPLKHRLKEQPSDCAEKFPNAVVIIFTGIKEEGIREPGDSDFRVGINFGEWRYVFRKPILVNGVMEGLSEPRQQCVNYCS